MKFQITLVIINSMLFSSFVWAGEIWKTYGHVEEEAIYAVENEGDIVWCGTHTGLLKYDRITKEKIRFMSDDGLIHNIINDITIDANGVKWIATDFGISSFDDITWTSYTSENGLGNDKVIAIAVDNNNVKWFVSDYLVTSFDGDQWHIFNEENVLPPTQFYCVAVDKNNVKWFGTGTQGILSYNDVKWIKHETTGIKKHQPFWSIAVDDNNIKWAAANDNFLFYYDDITWEAKSIGRTEFDGPYYAVAVDGGDNKYVITDGGLIKYRNPVISRINTVCQMYDFAVDDEGILWIGGEKGLFTFINTGTYTYYIANDFESKDLLNKFVSSIAIDRNNIKWFGHGSLGVHGNGGLSRFDGESWSYPVQLNDPDYPTGLEKEKYWGNIIAIDNNNVLWTNALASLVSYDGKQVKDHVGFWKEDSSIAGYVSSIVVDDYNLKWVASIHNSPLSNYKCYVAVYNESDIDYLIKDYGRSFYSIALDTNQTVWAGSNEGLLHFDGVEWEIYMPEDGLTGNGIRTVASDKNNTIWMARYDITFPIPFVRSLYYYNLEGSGLSCFDGTTWTAFTTENCGIASNTFYDIKFDQNDIMWIGTNAGVSRFDGETWTTFNTENSGLCDNRVNAIEFEKDNTIWFGTANGASKYTGEIITTSVEEEEKTPETIPVINSYPNPFNPSTTIEFTLPESGYTTLTIYTISGQKVKELAADYLTTGTHCLTWDGRDDSGNAVSSGVYITRLVTWKQVTAGRMILLK